MTAKRFILYEHKDNDYILDNPNVHLDFIEMLGDALTSEEIVDKLNALHEENEQLQARNDRQAKQLDNLYTLIEKQDWKTLKGLIQEFQECEEQLQREWRTYE